jgi:hypothetical protein
MAPAVMTKPITIMMMKEIVINNEQIIILSINIERRCQEGERL